MTLPQPPIPKMSTGDIANKSDRDRLRDHFSTENTPSRWDDLWSTGTWLPWDRGTPNPALIDVLTTKQAYLGPPVIEEDGKQRRKKALVPGCGKGYDVFLFAAFGYDAYGLEGSSNAIKACETFRGDAEGKEEYAIRDEKAGRGSVKFVLGDFFSKEWEKEVGEEEVKFDVIYDYTVSRSPLFYLLLRRGEEDELLILACTSSSAPSNQNPDPLGPNACTTSSIQAATLSASNFRHTKSHQLVDHRGLCHQTCTRIFFRTRARSSSITRRGM